MGKRWRKHEVGGYRLQQLKGQAVAVWREGVAPPSEQRNAAPFEIIC